MRSRAPIWTASVPGLATASPLTVSGVWAGRYYDPTMGRFTQSDTIVPSLSNPQSLNRYSYVNNSPMSYMDEDGHCPPCVIAAAVGIGAGAGALLSSAVYMARVGTDANKTFTWGGLAGAATNGAVSGGLTVLAVSLGPSTVSLAASTLAAGEASGIGYYAGKAVENSINKSQGLPVLAPTRTESMQNAISGAGGNAIGGFVSARIAGPATGRGAGQLSPGIENANVKDVLKDASQRSSIVAGGIGLLTPEVLLDTIAFATNGVSCESSDNESSGNESSGSDSSDDVDEGILLR